MQKAQHSQGVVLRLVRGGGPAPVLNDVYRRYCRYLATLVLRLDGRATELDDLVQDVFVAAATGITRLREPEAIRCWLATIAVRAVRRRLRIRRTWRFLGLDRDAGDMALAGPSVSSADGVLLRAVYEVLEDIPAPDRLAFALHVIEGETMEAVAQLCGCATATAKRRVARGRRLIEQKLRMDEGRDLMERIASAAAHLESSLSERDVERLVAGARRRRRRRDRIRPAVLAAGAAASLTLTGGLVALHRTGHTAAAEIAGPMGGPPAPPAGRIVRLWDGSTATPLDADTQIELLEARPERVVLSLTRGLAQFQVTPRAERTFWVHAGNVRINVASAMFTLEHVADRVGVTVQRGIVHIDWHSGTASVQAGHSGWYPPD